MNIEKLIAELLKDTPGSQEVIKPLALAYSILIKKKLLEILLTSNANNPTETTAIDSFLDAQFAKLPPDRQQTAKGVLEAAHFESLSQIFAAFIQELPQEIGEPLRAKIQQLADSYQNQQPVAKS